jgi:peptide subunit release factor 1 (eRF1)
MADATTQAAQSLSQRMAKLAALEPSPFPVLSLYLNLLPNETGREDYEQFIRKVFAERGRAYREESAERQSLEQDAEKIRAFLENDKQASWNGLAIFACAGADLFEAIPLDAAIEEHWLFIGSVPHLYPLAKVIDTFPRYAAVLLDTNKARILVYSVDGRQRDERVVNEKTRRSSQGGWSQARYQRRAENVHLHHIKEVVDTLDRVVRAERIQQIVVSGDEVAVPLLKEQLPQQLAEKLVDVVRMERNAGEPDIFDRTYLAVREKDAETDVETVQELMDEWRSGGLGVAGPKATLRAFQMGQVDELIITGSPDALKPVQKLPEDAAPGPVQAESSSPQPTPDEQRLKLAGELIARAQQTSARVRFIEDPALLADIGGVGALLRFRI